MNNGYYVKGCILRFHHQAIDDRNTYCAGICPKAKANMESPFTDNSAKCAKDHLHRVRD